MSRFCALEALYFMATGRRQLATRRGGEGAVAVPVAGIAVPTFYHRIGEVEAALSDDARLAAIEGIGVAIPPPFLEPRWRQMPVGLRRLMTGVDWLVAPLPLFNRVGDHVLLHFVKGNAHA
jgi:hypothetical protein